VAGKTTAFNLMSGMFRPTAVRSRSPGRSIAGLAPEHHPRRRRAIVPDHQSVPNLSIGENVRLAVKARV